MQLTDWAVRRELHMVEAAMRVSRIISCLALVTDSIFGESQKRIKQRLEMRFADQRGCVAGST